MTPESTLYIMKSYIMSKLYEAALDTILGPTGCYNLNKEDSFCFVQTLLSLRSVSIYLPEKKNRV